MNKAIKRLDLASDEACQLSDALDLVIAQPVNAVRGNHAHLVSVMYSVFGIWLTKQEAVEGALYALWRDEDVLGIETDDMYVNQLKERAKYEQQMAEMADLGG